ncbi:hypothetical protein GH721_02040 [Kriegella sp. EG-1]|nr:hypothetical protein [Flavobacteriaceae bacterium EG-1]
MEKGIKILVLAISFIYIISCGTTKNVESIPDLTDDELAVFNETVGDTIQIADEETEYEIIIIEPGFNTWLLSIAKPEGYYTQSYLETRNQLYVINWNQRVLNPQQYNPSLYEMQIDYDNSIDYGYEVNYKLYNYFIYFQRKYKQRLGPFLPRI